MCLHNINTGWSENIEKPVKLMDKNMNKYIRDIFVVNPLKMK